MANFCLFQKNFLAFLKENKLNLKLSFRIFGNFKRIMEVKYWHQNVE